MPYAIQCRVFFSRWRNWTRGNVPPTNERRSSVSGYQIYVTMLNVCLSFSPETNGGAQSVCVCYRLRVQHRCNVGDCCSKFTVAFVDSINAHVPSIQCLEWSKKEAGSLPQCEVECPGSPEFFKYLFLIWKWRVLMHSWWYFMRFRATRE